MDLEGPGALGVGGDPGDVAVGLVAVGRPSAPGGRRVPSGATSTTSAPSWSWPSRNTVARDGQRLARRGLGREATEVDQGHDVHDGDATDHARHPSESPPRMQDERPVPGPGADGVAPRRAAQKLERSSQSRLPSLGCVRSDDSPSARSCLRPSPRSAISPATCGGPGTRRPRTSSPRSTPRSGRRPSTTRCACSARSSPSGSRQLAADQGFLDRLGAAKADLDAYLGGERWYSRRAGAEAPDPDRLLLPGVRHHRGAAAVLRRPRHPRRRPPEGRQRPRRPAGRRRPALPRRLLQAVALPRGLAARAVPRPRPRRAADLAAPRGERRARR